MQPHYSRASPHVHPLDFDTPCLNMEVLCVDVDKGHMQDASNSSPFAIILVNMYKDDHEPIACVYSSEIGVWTISSQHPFNLSFLIPVGMGHLLPCW